MNSEYRRFITYHPFLTYSNPENQSFVDHSGRKDSKTNEDIETLLHIGRDAYSHLAPHTKGEFESGLQFYHTFIGNCRKTLMELDAKGSLTLTNKRGEPTTAYWDEIDDENILAVIWQIRSKGYLSDEVTDDLLAQMYIYHAFIEIDDAMIDLTTIREGGSVYAAVNAANALSNVMSLIYGSEQLRAARREMAYRGALAKLKGDRRQDDKKWVYERWLAWQEKPEEFESKADFARTLIKHCEHLKSTKKIEDWCREWEKKKWS